MRKEAILEIIFQAVDKVSPALGSIGRGLSGLGGPFALLGSVASGAFDLVSAAAGGLAGVIAITTNKAADFDQQMANVNAVLTMSKDEYAKLTDEVMRLGRETIFTSQDAALAIEALARGGATFEQIMGGAGQAALDLASATKSGMEESAQVMLGVMNQFDILPEHASHAADVMAGAINHANMTLIDFSYAMRATGALSHEMGLSFEEVSAGLAMFGRAGIVGEAAGTGLKVMLTNLVPKSKTATEVFEKFGFIVDGVNQFFDQSTGKVRPAIEIFQLLKEKLGEVDTAEKVNALKQMFGQRSAVITELLVASRDGGIKYQEFMDIINGTSATDIASKRLDSMRGSAEKLKGEIETASIVIGSAFLPTIKKGTDFLEGLLSSVQPLIAAFSDWLALELERLPETLANLFGIDTSKLMEGIKPLQDFLTGLMAGDLTSGDKKLLGTFDIDTMPAKQSLEDLRPVISETLDNLFGEGTGDALLETIDSLVQGAKDFVGWITAPETKESAQKIFDGLSNIAGLIDTIMRGADEADDKGGVLGVIGIIVDSIAGVDEATKTFQHLFDILKAPFDMTFWEGLGAIVDESLAGVSDSIQGMVDDAVATVAGWATDFGVNLGLIAVSVSEKWEEIKTTVATKLSEIWDGLKTKLGEFLSEITTKGAAILLDVQNKWTEIKNKITQTLEDIWSEIRLKFDAILREITDKLKSILGDVQKKWDEIYNSISTKVSEILELAKSKFDEIKEAIGTRITEAKDEAIRVLGEMVTGFLTHLGQVISDAKAKFDEWKTELVARVTKAKDDALTEAGKIVSGFFAFWTKILTDAAAEMVKLPSKVKEGIDKLLTKITDWAAEIATEALKLGKSLVQGMWQGILDMSGWLWEKITGWIAGLLGGGAPPGGPGGGNPGNSLGRGLAQNIGDGFNAGMRAQANVMASTHKSLVEKLRSLTDEQMAMLQSPFSGENGLDAERVRSLRKLGMDMNRTGKGGFVAASSKNYYDVWMKRHGAKYALQEGNDPFSPVMGGPPYVPPPPAPRTPPPGPVPPPPQMTVNITMEADGLVVGKWAKVLAPHLAKKGDRWTFTG